MLPIIKNKRVILNITDKSLGNLLHRVANLLENHNLENDLLSLELGEPTDFTDWIIYLSFPDTKSIENMEIN